MNANRKADLQRKLSLAPVPKPPAGLAERIKSDIPKHLRFDVEKERQRLSRSIAFDIRVAASILILVLSAYATLHLMTRMNEGGPAATGAAPRAAASKAAPPEKQLAPAAKVAKKEKTRRPVRVAEAKRAPAPRLPLTVVQAQPAAAAVAEEAPMREMRTARMAGVSVSMRDEFDAVGVVQRFARADAMPSHDVRLEDELVTTPFGKTMLRLSIDSGVNISDITLDIDGLTKSKWPALAANASLTSVYEMTPKSIRLRYRDDGVAKAVEHEVHRVAWPAAAQRTKAAVLANEWARGGDRREIARLAREAGLNELADFVERNPR
jgi:hypothetical protein